MLWELLGCKRSETWKLLQLINHATRGSDRTLLHTQPQRDMVATAKNLENQNEDVYQLTNHRNGTDDEGVV